MNSVKWLNLPPTLIGDRSGKLNSKFFFLPYIFFLFSFIYGLENENLKTLTLQQAIQIGLENQPSLKAMESEKKMADYELGMAKTNFYPKLSANTFLSKGNMPMIYNSLSMPNYTGMVPGESSWLQDFMLMVPIYTGGKNLGTYNKAKQEKEAVGFDYQSEKLNLVLEIKTMYRMGLFYRELKQVYQEMVRESEERVKNDREAYEVGKIAYVNVLRNEARLSQSKQMLTDTEKEYKTVLVKLRAFMGLESAVEIDLAPEIPEPEKINFTKEQTLEMALSNRPDVQALARKLNASKEGLSVSRSELYPRVAVAAMQDFFEEEDSSDSGYSYGLVISFPFFGSGEAFYKIQQSKEKVKQSEYQYQSEILKTQAEVDAVWLAIDAARQNIQTAKTGVTQAEEDYRIMKLAYETGKKINIEYLDALVVLYQAKTDYAKSILDYNLSIDRLIRLLGQDEFLPAEPAYQ